MKPLKNVRVVSFDIIGAEKGMKHNSVQVKMQYVCPMVQL